MALDLFDAGAKLQQNVQGDSDPLLVAVKRNSIDCLLLLLEKGTAANNPNNEKMSPLMQAIAQHLYFAVDCLLDSGVDPNFSTDKGDTALLISMFVTDPKIKNVINSLILKGADPNIADSLGATAIHRCCQYQNLELLKLLVNHGGHLQTKDKKMKSALSYCLMNNDPEAMQQMVEYLLENGLDINEKDDNGSTFLLDLLPDSSKVTPEFLQFIVNRGADVNAVARNGKTATQIAKMFYPKNPEIQKIFEQNKEK